MSAVADILHITRQFKAPRDRVFAAFTSAEMLALWMGPGPCAVSKATVDLRVGGAYRFIIDNPEGQMCVGGTYREIKAPEKLVFTWAWEDDDDWEGVESVVSIEFLAHGVETEMRFTQTGFPSPESSGRHEHGWGGSFDKLDGVLATA